MKTIKEIADYFGIKKLPEIADTKSGPLLVMCPAKCLWDDISKVDLSRFNTLAVKEVSWFFVRTIGRPLNHAASFEEEVNLTFTHGFHNGIPLAAETIHTVTRVPVDGAHVWDVTRHCGTSGLFGTVVGVLMGYLPVILAGSPVDSSPHFYDPDYLIYDVYARQGHQTEWKNACEMFKGRAFSLSGNTREWLGEP